MRKNVVAVAAGVSLLVLIGIGIKLSSQNALARFSAGPEMVAEESKLPIVSGGFSVDVIVDGRRLEEYEARGRHYIEAFEKAEYELRIHNPTGSRVAVALSVDGMNTIDARHTTAWEAHKWVIAPYSTITVGGWQMSSENARRFYFTTERDSYGAKIGQTANLGLITAVFFRERNPVVITPVVPGRRSGGKDESRKRDEKAPKESTESASTSTSGDAAKTRNAPGYPPPDDESAATGIGRTVSNGVQWIKMELDSNPVGEVTIRYEYRAALVRLGVIPRSLPRQDVLDRREKAVGFEPKYCPQP
jgi:hypothetical protein